MNKREIAKGVREFRPTLYVAKEHDGDDAYDSVYTEKRDAVEIGDERLVGTYQLVSVELVKVTAKVDVTAV